MKLVFDGPKRENFKKLVAAGTKKERRARQAHKAKEKARFAGPGAVRASPCVQTIRCPRITGMKRRCAQYLLLLWMFEREPLSLRRFALTRSSGPFRFALHKAA